MTAVTNKNIQDRLMKEKTLEMKNIFELIETNTYEKKNKKNTIPEGLISTKEKHAMKKNRYKERNDPEQNRRMKISVIDRAGSLMLQTRHQYIKVPNQKRTAMMGKKRPYAKACRQRFNNNGTAKRLTEEEMNEPDKSSSESHENIHHKKANRNQANRRNNQTLHRSSKNEWDKERV